MPTGELADRRDREPALEVAALAEDLAEVAEHRPTGPARAPPLPESWVRMNTNVPTVMTKATTKSGRMASASTLPGRHDDQRAEDGPDDAEQPRRDGLADRHAGRPVLVRQAVAADGGAAVAADRVAEPVGHHRQDRDGPALRQRVGQVRDREQGDAGEVEGPGTVAVDEPAGEGTGQAGHQHPEAVDEAELGRRGAQRDDVDGQVGEDHLVREPVQRGPDDGHHPVALLAAQEGQHRPAHGRAGRHGRALGHVRRCRGSA